MSFSSFALILVRAVPDVRGGDVVCGDAMPQAVRAVGESGCARARHTVEAVVGVGFNCIRFFLSNQASECVVGIFRQIKYKQRW